MEKLSGIEKQASLNQNVNIQKLHGNAHLDMMEGKNR
jgi:hypothetical protein